MCLSLQKGATTFKKAGEDIVCYKVLVKNDTLRTLNSPYQWTGYKLGQLKVDKIPVKKEVVNTTNILSKTEKTVESGVFHSFKFYDDAKEFAIEAVASRYWKYYNDNYPVVVKCFIPKGSRYYEGMFGGVLYPKYQCYGSKQLKVGDEITYVPTWEDVKDACPFPYINQLKEEVLRLTGIPKERFNQ